MPHLVSQALSLHHVLCCGCCRCMAMVGIVLQLHLLRGHGGCHCTVLCHGQGCCMVMVGVVVPCYVTVMMGVSCDVMSQSQLLHCMVVLWSQSLHCVWCHGHGHCTACGVIGIMGVTLHGVTGITLHLVSQSWSLHCVVLWLWWLSSCLMGLW